MVQAHEWAGGVAHAPRRATDGSDDHTMVNWTLHGLGLGPAAPRTRPVANPGAALRTDKATRRGRHAKSPTSANWARGRALPWLRENRGVVLAAAVVLVLIVSVAGIAGWGDDPAPSCGLFYAGKQDTDVCADAGGTVSVDKLTISATPLALLDNGSGLSLCTTVDLTNDSGDDQNYSTADFKIQNPAGEMSSRTSGTLAPSSTLASGASQSGTICDTRPIQTGAYALIYEPSVLGAQRGVWLSEQH